MRLLIDSQSLIWFVDQDHLLTAPAHAAIRDPANDLAVSAATIWEIAIKVGLGRLRLAQPFRPWMSQAITDLGLSVLPITARYADVQASLPLHHRDPFDRMIAAQAIANRIGIVSSDQQFDAYGVTRVW